MGKRHFVIGAVLAVLAAVGGTGLLGGGTGASAQATVTLKFMRPGRFDVVERVCRPIVGAFEKENPGIKVEFVDMGWDEYFTRLPILLSSRTTPDVMLNQRGGSTSTARRTSSSLWTNSSTRSCGSSWRRGCSRPTP